MGDIAQEAGISRQTLYARYAGKDQVLVAVIDAMTRQKVADVKAAWEGDISLADKLDRYFDVTVTSYFDQVQMMPDSADLVTGYNETGKAAMDASATAKKALLISVLSSYERPLGKAGLSPGLLADIVYAAATGFSYSASDKKHLQVMLGGLRQMILSVTGPG